MRALLFGFTAGVTLSALRAPLGLDLFSLPARSAGSSYGYRAAALVVVALGLFAAGRGLDGARNLRRVVGGAAAGLGLHALLLGRMPESAAGAVALALIALGVLVFAGRIAGGDVPAPGTEGGGDAGGDADADAAGRRAPRAGEATGLAVAGAGIALGLEGLARHLRLLGPGLPAEHGLLAAVLMALVLAGGVSFGRAVPAGAASRVWRALFIAFAGLGGLVGLAVLRAVATPGGLHGYLSSFEPLELDASRAGMADYTLLLGAAALVAAGLALGATLFTLHTRRQLGALLLGAAAGLALIPGLLALPADGAPAMHSAGLVRHGALVALLGAALCAAFAPGASRLFRGGALLIALGASFPVLRLEVAQVPITRPWREHPQPPLFVLDSPEGLLSVDRSRGGLTQLTLDGRELTPTTDRAQLERRSFELSFALLPPDGLASGAVRVLLVGQLTPGRALALGDLGAGRIDRTGAWHRAMPALEEQMFGDPPAIPGEVLSPAEARGRLASGSYDLVLVPAVPGEAPATRNLASPADTTTVVWFDGASDMASRHLGEVLVTTDLENLLVAVANGAWRPPTGARPAGAPAFLPAGLRERPPAPYAWLALLRHERAFLAHTRLTRRLAEARDPAPAGARALAAHFAAQRHSSPYETRAQRIELDPAALVAIGEAAGGPEPSSLDVDLAEGLAQVLGGKRWPDELRRHLTAGADRHWPWPVLEQALAYAHLEALEPAVAAERLARVVEQVPGEPELWALLGEALYQLGEPARAAEAYTRGHDLLPDSHELERRLAMALVRAGDPLGTDLIQELLLEEPDDEELRLYLDSNALPEIPRGYRPSIIAPSSHQHAHGVLGDH